MNKMRTKEQDSTIFQEDLRQGGYLTFPSNVSEATTLEDCVLIDCQRTYWMIIRFREEFVKVRLTRKKYEELMNQSK